MRKLPYAVLIALFCATWLGLAAGLQSCSRQGQTSQNSTLDRVLTSKTIRAAYLVRPPNIIKDPNTGKLSGIFVDIVDEIGRRAGLRVEWVEEVTWSNMIEGLNSSRYDIVGTGIWRNATRGLAADFTQPLFYSGVGVYVRTNDHRFDGNLALINSGDVRVATIDGEMAEIIAKSDFPSAQAVSLTQISDTSQLLLEVQSNKADVTFLAAQIGARYIEKNPGMVRNIAADRPIRVFPEALLLKKGDYEFKAALDSAITEIVNSDFVEKTIKKYDSASTAYYLVADPYRPFK